VLDAGGGTGKRAIPIVEKGLKVVLYDMSRKMLSVARRKIVEKSLENMVVFKEGDICEIDYPDDSFDFLAETQYLIAVILIKPSGNWLGFLNPGASWLPE
jgi:ubiquinone/menaquinone biosynthesis C-methylase UbiE